MNWKHNEDDLIICNRVGAFSECENCDCGHEHHETTCCHGECNPTFNPASTIDVECINVESGEGEYIINLLNNRDNY